MGNVLENEATTNNTSKKEKRVPYRVIVDEHEPFSPDYEGKYVTSIEFCKLATDYFKAAFANFYGCKISMQNEPMMLLYFTHLDDFDPEVDENGIAHVHVATERAVKRANVHDNIIERARRRDNLRDYGDKYNVTEDGKDIIAPLLLPRLYNRGKINWANIITETSNSQNSIYNTAPIQLTQFSGIDICRVAHIIWGSKDQNGNDIDYGMFVKRDAPIGLQYGMPGYGASNFVLEFKMAHTEEIKKTYNKLGIGMIGSDIVR